MNFNPTSMEKALALAEAVTNAIASGTVHRNRKGELLTTPEQVLRCLREEGEVQLSRASKSLIAYQDMTGIELADEVDIHEAPLASAPDADHWRFLVWLDDFVVPLARGKVRLITAVAPDGKRLPITMFACSPRPEEDLA